MMPSILSFDTTHLHYLSVTYWPYCFSSVNLEPVEDQYVKQQVYMTVIVHLLRKNVNYAVPMILAKHRSVGLLFTILGSWIITFM